MLGKKHILPFVLVLSILSTAFSGCGGGAELLEWSPPPTSTTTTTTTTTTDNATFTEPTTTTSPPVTPVNNLPEAQIAARKLAEDFIRNSSTFKFDGIEGSIKLIKDGPNPFSAFRSWGYTFEFQTRHPGHGDRTGQSLVEFITTHSASVLMEPETGRIIGAVCDNTWDMKNEKDLPPPSTWVSGIVVSGGDTTLPGGPVDAPRVFVYKILRDEGMNINVSYTAYPPSPAGDAAGAKITLDFYNGDVRVGDKIEACGTLDKKTNTVVVAKQCDFIRTSLRKTTVLGVVVSIKDAAPPDSPGDAPRQYVYELLREDGTFINVSDAAKEGVAHSLYNETIQVGDYMKAVGMYDKSTNSVVISAQGDWIKTYPYRTRLGE